MITSSQNSLIKHLRHLGESTKYRKKQQEMLLEGTHLLQEALKAKYSLSVICYTEKWQTKEPNLFDRISRLAYPIELVADHVLDAITTTQHPDGVVCSAPLVPFPDLKMKKIGIALEGVQDPGNMGAIVRTALAAGAEGIIISQNCVDITNPKVLRATAGQWFRSSFKLPEDFTAELVFWQNQGMRLVATIPNSPNTYWDYDYSQPTLLVLGNEGRGLSPEVIEVTDMSMSIPTDPMVESLNVAMTTTLLLYEAKRQSIGKSAPMP